MSIAALVVMVNYRMALAAIGDHRWRRQTENALRLIKKGLKADILNPLRTCRGRITRESRAGSTAPAP